MTARNPAMPMPLGSRSWLGRALLLSAALAALLVSSACTADREGNAVSAEQAPSSPAAQPHQTPMNHDDPLPDDPIPDDPVPDDAAPEIPADSDAAPQTELATFGAGCFWCVEAVLEQLDGVIDVTSGYMGGEVDRPTYRQVCSGSTGHAEVVQVTFDPTVLPYSHLVEWFWQLHDPTTLNRQGADVGTQYRSVIFFHSPEQETTAKASMAEAAARFSNPIVTEISPAGTYWLAEADHQNFYELNRTYGYCRAVIAPKLDKLGLEK